MTDSFLEHVNITVSSPDATAKTLCELFGWHIRWQGEAIHGGNTIHVGSENSYIAVYAQSGIQQTAGDSYKTRGGLNHIAVVVNDLDETEKRVLAAGFKATSHADYEPGRRFYFHDDDDIEFEVVSYNSK